MQRAIMRPASSSCGAATVRYPARPSGMKGARISARHCGKARSSIDRSLYLSLPKATASSSLAAVKVSGRNARGSSAQVAASTTASGTGATSCRAQEPKRAPVKTAGSAIVHSRSLRISEFATSRYRNISLAISSAVRTIAP